MLEELYDNTSETVTGTINSAGELYTDTLDSARKAAIAARVATETAGDAAARTPGVVAGEVVRQGTETVKDKAVNAAKWVGTAVAAGGAAAVGGWAVRRWLLGG